jgi:hypothetical protein
MILRYYRYVEPIEETYKLTEDPYSETMRNQIFF